MQPTPVIPDLAPSSSSSAAKPASLERHLHLGRMVAGMASALGLALAERRTGGVLTSETKRRAGELLAELYCLLETMAGNGDFYALARQHGTAAMREMREIYGAKVSSEMIDKLITEALSILSGFVKTQSN